MKFKKGDSISFHRNSIINGNNVKIVATDAKNKFHIIENEHGWVPDIIRLEQFDLNAKKKYLYIKDSELHPVKPKGKEKSAKGKKK